MAIAFDFCAAQSILYWCNPVCDAFASVPSSGHARGRYHQTPFNALDSDLNCDHDWNFMTYDHEHRVHWNTILTSIFEDVQSCIQLCISLQWYDQDFSLANLVSGLGAEVQSKLDTSELPEYMLCVSHLRVESQLDKSHACRIYCLNCHDVAYSASRDANPFRTICGILI